MGFTPVQADPFTASGVSVEVTAETLQAAKDQAIIEAQRKGVTQVMQRLAGETVKLPELDGAMIVRDFMVEDERTFGKTYRGVFSVRYQGSAITNALKNAGIKYAEPRNRPVLVVPALQTLVSVGPMPSADGKEPETGSYLWEAANPWAKGWREALPHGGLVPVILAQGNPMDQESITVEQALAKNAEALNRLQVRYGRADLMLAVAVLDGAGQKLDVSLTGGPSLPKPFEDQSFDRQPGESDDAFYARVATFIAKGMNDTFKQSNVFSHDVGPYESGRPLSVLVPLQSLNDWVNVRNRLGAVSQVRKVDVVMVSRTEAAITMYILGSDEQLAQSLRNAGLVMEWGGTYWILRPL